MSRRHILSHDETDVVQLLKELERCRTPGVWDVTTEGQVMIGGEEAVFPDDDIDRAYLHAATKHIPLLLEIIARKFIV